MEHDKVLERLAYVVERAIGKPPYDKDIAEEIGLSPANYSNMKQKKTLPLQAIINYCGRKKVSISWIFFEQSSAMLVDNTGEILKIRYLSDVSGSAGGGAFNDNENFTFLSLDPEYVKRLGISEKDKIDAINVIGESMHPTLRDGSIVLIDKNKTNIAKGGIFAINASGNLFIKRISLNPTGGIDLLSDNPAIPSQTVSVDEVFVVGEVIGAMETF